MAGMKRQRRNAKEWGRLVREQPGSGLSVARFCRRARVSSATFYAWRRRLGNAPVARPSPANCFMEVKIAAEDTAEATSEDFPGASPEASRPIRPLELRLSGKRSVLIPPGFDPPTLRALLAVLERDATGAADSKAAAADAEASV